jgi:methylthioribose-1-phosphate isomerase
MTPTPSPLFEPVLWEETQFKILDELALPDRIEYLTITELRGALNAVQQMRTRAFGQVLTFLYSAALVAQSQNKTSVEALRQTLDDLTQQFCAARPTFDFQGLGTLLSEALTMLPSNANAGGWLAEFARGFAQEIIEARRTRARLAAEILPSPTRVLTHCNISGELLAVAQNCKQMKKSISVFATETRPYLQGARLTAWELSQGGVPVTVIPDCAVAQLMAKGEVNAVVVGADRVAQNADIVNKVGTYSIALMAQQYGVPFYALVQGPRSLACGDDAQIEERPVAELLTFHGQPFLRSGTEKLRGRYPAFDVTPSHLITRLVGFDGVFTAETFRQRFQQARSPNRNKAQAAAKYLLIYGIPTASSYSYLRNALKREQASHVLVPEMRPGLWGVREVTRELLKRDIPTTLISDNMIGMLLARGEVRRMYMFYLGMSQAGPKGICGSLLAVQLARLHDIPVELIEGGKATSLALDSDVSTFLGQRVCPPEASIYPVTEEITPWSLLKAQGSGS